MGEGQPIYADLAIPTPALAALKGQWPKTNFLVVGRLLFWSYFGIKKWERNIFVRQIWHQMKALFK